MFRKCVQRVRQVLTLIWHFLRKPPVEKVIEEKWLFAIIEASV